MGTLVGSVDHRRRPLVRIERPDGFESFLALLDTGFNGEVFVAIADVERLGFRLRSGFSTFEDASGQIKTVQRGAGEIMWLGERRRVEVFIATEPPPARQADDPVALVGTGLLTANMLLIDFPAATIEIEG